MPRAWLWHCCWRQRSTQTERTAVGRQQISLRDQRVLADGKEPPATIFQLCAHQDHGRFAAVFDGPDLGFRTVLGMLPKVRTNMTPTRFLAYMRTP